MPSGGNDLQGSLDVLWVSSGSSMDFGAGMYVGCPTNCGLLFTMAKLNFRVLVDGESGGFSVTSILFTDNCSASSISLSLLISYVTIGLLGALVFN